MWPLRGGNSGPCRRPAIYQSPEHTPHVSPSQATSVFMGGSGGRGPTALMGRKLKVAVFRPHGGARHWHHTPPPVSQFCNVEPLRMAFVGPIFAVNPVSAIGTGLAPIPSRASAAKVEYEIATPRRCRPRLQKSMFSKAAGKGGGKEPLASALSSLGGGSTQRTKS